MNSYKAGIVLPSYNKHEYLLEAVDSILSQTHRDFLLIIVNDYCGIDAEEKKDELDRLVADRDDSRIRVMHNQTNIGISRSRNRAIRVLLEQNVPYVFFIDHDDIWSCDEKLAEQISLLSLGDVGLIGTQFDVINKIGKVIGASHNPVKHEDMLRIALLSCPMLMSSLGVNAHVLRENGMLDETLNGCDDWEFIIRNLPHYKGINIPDTMVSYRMFGGNTSTTEWHRLIKEQMVVMRKRGKDYPSYYKALAIGYMRLLIPQEYKEKFRPLKNLLLPEATTIRLKTK